MLWEIVANENIWVSCEKHRKTDENLSRPFIAGSCKSMS
jgi:hypothetical protein